MQAKAESNFIGPPAPPFGKPDPLQTRQVQEFKHGSPLLGSRFDATGRFVFAGVPQARRPNRMIFLGRFPRLGADRPTL